MKNKPEKLKKTLSGMKSVLIAYSGGVDSTFLVKAAYDVLGGKAVAITAVSELYPEEDLKRAVRDAKKIGIKHIIIKTKEMKNRNFTDNSPSRCYFCKKELFEVLSVEAAKRKLNYVLLGATGDDEKDYRPGMKAAEEYGVRSPLKEAGLFKKDIRLLSKKMKLSTAGLPASPCLASRFPYGHRITGKDIKKVAAAEKYLRGLGLVEFRVRHYDSTARIEVHGKDRNLILKNSGKIVNYLKKTGYTYVSLDLEGFRSGSMNEVLNRVK